jgi:aspartate/methionine/tyrosine aminotransferase
VWLVLDETYRDFLSMEGGTGTGTGTGPPHTLFSHPDWRDTLVSLYSFSKGYAIPGKTPPPVSVVTVLSSSMIRVSSFLMIAPIMHAHATGPFLLLRSTVLGNNFLYFIFSSLLTGARLGAITCGPAMSAAVLKVVDNVQICAPRGVQAALTPLLGDADVLAWQLSNRLRMSARRAAFVDAMGQADVLGDGWEVVASGAYFAYVKHPFIAGTTTTTVSSHTVACTLALERGVLTLPGSVFGGKHPPSQDGFLRFAFANVEEEVLQTLPARLTGLAF